MNPLITPKVSVDELMEAVLSLKKPADVTALANVQLAEMDDLIAVYHQSLPNVSEAQNREVHALLSTIRETIKNAVAVLDWWNQIHVSDLPGSEMASAVFAKKMHLHMALTKMYFFEVGTMTDGRNAQIRSLEQGFTLKNNIDFTATTSPEAAAEAIAEVLKAFRARDGKPWDIATFISDGNKPNSAVKDIFLAWKHRIQDYLRRFQPISQEILMERELLIATTGKTHQEIVSLLAQGWSVSDLRSNSATLVYRNIFLTIVGTKIIKF